MFLLCFPFFLCTRKLQVDSFISSLQCLDAFSARLLSHLQEMDEGCIFRQSEVQQAIVLNVHSILNQLEQLATGLGSIVIQLQLLPEVHLEVVPHVGLIQDGATSVISKVMNQEVQFHLRAQKQPVLIFEVAEQRFAFTDVHDVLNCKDIKVGINGCQLSMHSLAFLLIPFLQLLDHLTPIVVGLTPFS